MKKNYEKQFFKFYDGNTSALGTTMFKTAYREKISR
ncbi:hypothetical protein AHMF7616_00403 [Adhaeribacter pallidiroseus]|uniref:Uncharacterized protein n=1 Tax=Adhaeribacter pallidiroseus TaxID=2072847 RepID=A0A369QAT9_9BACT|nr:hypothetical protein AHMF7616_00403 [Adhaeribacter pallidiroseus]